MLVEDDEVERQSLEAQVLVRLQQLDDERRRRRSSATRTSRIGRSPEMPYFHSSRWPRRFCLDRRRRRAAACRRRAGGRRGAETRIVSSTVRPRCRSSIWLCVLASASARATARRSWYFSIRCSARLFALGIRGREREPRGRPGRQADRLPQADDRIEDRARRVRQRRPADEREPDARACRPRPMKRARSVSYCVGDAHAAAAAEHVDQIQPLRCPSADAARRSARRAPARCGSRRTGC